jgi:hypothetical protein
MKTGIIKNHEHTYKFYLNHCFFYEAFKYKDGAKFWGYAGTNVEPLCTEFCNFTKCHIFANYLTSY